MGTRGTKTSPEALFGDEVVRLRKLLGVSQEELAFRAEVHRTYISQLERGLKSPTLNMILKLSRALKASATQAGGNGRKATVAVPRSTMPRRSIPRPWAAASATPTAAQVGGSAISLSSVLVRFFQSFQHLSPGAYFRCHNVA